VFGQSMKSDCECYNLGTGGGWSVLQLLKAFSKAAGKDLPYKISPRREGDVAISYADVKKANGELKWSAQLGIDDACRDALKWQFTNPYGFNDPPPEDDSKKNGSSLSSSAAVGSSGSARTLAKGVPFLTVQAGRVVSLTGKVDPTHVVDPVKSLFFQFIQAAMRESELAAAADARPDIALSVGVLDLYVTTAFGLKK